MGMVWSWWLAVFDQKKLSSRWVVLPLPQKPVLTASTTRVPTHSTLSPFPIYARFPTFSPECLPVLLHPTSTQPSPTLPPLHHLKRSRLPIRRYNSPNKHIAFLQYRQTSLTAELFFLSSHVIAYRCGGNAGASHVLQAYKRASTATAAPSSASPTAGYQSPRTYTSSPVDRVDEPDTKMATAEPQTEAQPLQQGQAQDEKKDETTKVKRRVPFQGPLERRSVERGKRAIKVDSRGLAGRRKDVEMKGTKHRTDKRIDICYIYRTTSQSDGAHVLSPSHPAKSYQSYPINHQSAVPDRK
ncbi:hypothetical protein ACRALDRAFT_205201 [Sodiomyces alcalophilus JCM 7366]|uniref:uncharacterized protein n=1 Tax=Sodiomyces alcalophilus JCM 7366 TaxID=591952 RepID=UPI0039B3F015